MSETQTSLKPLNPKSRKAWATSSIMLRREADGLVYELHDNHRIYVLRRDSATTCQLIADYPEPKGRWDFCNCRKA